MVKRLLLLDQGGLSIFDGLLSWPPFRDGVLEGRAREIYGEQKICAVRREAVRHILCLEMADRLSVSPTSQALPDEAAAMLNLTGQGPYQYVLYEK